MAWYLIAYVVLFAVVGIAGILEDWHSRRPPGFIAGMVVALLVGVLSVFAFASSSFGDALGLWLWALLAFAISMEILSLVWDFRDLSRDNGRSRSGLVVITLLVSPLRFRHMCWALLRRHGRAANPRCRPLNVGP
jgi:hypothetical protein